MSATEQGRKDHDAGASASEMVIRKGRVFRFGDHIDGGGNSFSLTAAEFAAKHPPGTRVPIGWNPAEGGHYKGENDLDGMLGDAHDFEIKGQYLDAEFAIAPLLNAAIKKKELRMSAVFGWPEKELKRIDVVRRDRAIIPEAAFFARDEVAIPLEDAEFARKAAADPVPPPGSLSSHDEAENASMKAGFQHVHDTLAMAHPQVCMPGAMFARGDAMKRHIALAHKTCVNHGACCPGMSVKFAQEVPVSDETETVERVEPVDPRIEALEKRLAAERSKRIASDTAAFATANRSRIPAAARPLAEAIFASLSEDDDDAPVVMFAYQEGGARREIKDKPLNLFRDFVACLPESSATRELVIEGGKGDPAPRPREVLRGVRVFAGHDQDALPGDPTPDGQPISADRAAQLRGYLSGARNDGGEVYASKGSGQLAPRG